MQQIIGNQCKPEDDPVAWLEVMIRLYSRLRDADPKMMSDWDFAKHLITLMTRDENWRYCRDELRNKLRIAEIAGRPFPSQFVVRRLKDEEVELGIAPYVASLNTIMATSKGKTVERNQAVPGVYSVNDIANNASGSRQLRRDDRRFKPYPNQRGAAVSIRPLSTFNPNLICENTYCVFPQGHTVENCFVYGGGKAGQYPTNYNGPRDLHLSPNARVAARRKQTLDRIKGGKSTGAGIHNIGGGGGSRYAGLGIEGTSQDPKEVEKVLKRTRMKGCWKE
ncbi:hypothetical protein F5880DRAFT_1512700 [Lentinula raphanica]|nr:hypothetical protein F5880DRAFT_1512700 [Lentinula raphanica]